MGTDGVSVLAQLERRAPLTDPGSLAGAASLRLPARLESVRSARDFTRDILNTWRLAAQFDAVGLVVSELVTNALRHGSDGCPPIPGVSPVELELLRGRRRLVCAVHDQSTAEPHVNDADISDEGGRGLRLVECFSDGWGWRERGNGLRGKVVWASFRLD
ncbi:ATP-binding protein [Streptomyces otsuchiensis]|uniref:ATP-binding protein n=1 Tax=Streptomyces otsuchiensis TaxID=2681388 RepID=UPI001030D8F2|nr:ATP-binding protein [Streptomyces otsuchiensis]